MRGGNELFKVLTVGEAMERLRPYLLPFYERVEEVSLDEAWGRIVATDIFASCSVPHYRKSTVDGMAVRSSDTFGASESLPAFVTKTGEIFMGQAPEKTVSKGEGMLIPTGGMLPDGADAVVMVENLENFGDSLYGAAKPAAPGENVIEVGEDILAEESVFKKFTVIRAPEMGILAAQGIVSVPVITRMRVGILSTGDEIVPPGKAPGSAQTRDINGYSLLGQGQETGSIVRYYGIVGDDEAELRQKLQGMLEENDLVILSGGSSVGSRDLTAGLIEEAGEPGLLFHGLALRPGKPTIAGVVNGKVVFGLPGHPASAMIVFDCLIRPWLTASIMRDIDTPLPEGILTQNIYSGSGREEFVRVQLQKQGDDWYVEPIRGKSGLIRTMVRSDGLVHIGLDTEGLEAGQRVQIKLRQ